MSSSTGKPGMFGLLSTVHQFFVKFHRSHVKNCVHIAPSNTVKIIMGAGCLIGVW